MITKGLKGTRFSKIEPEFPVNLDGIGWYVHMPFCRRLCPYCSFRSIAYSEEKADRYARALKKEIALYKEKGGIGKTGEIYFGGGTPSLTWKKVIEIAEYFRSVFDVYGDFGMEASPEDIDEPMAELLKEAGINRISLGVQSFNANTLKRMNRKYDADTVLSAIDLLLKKGFYISLDLLYGMPGQDTSLLVDDLAVAAESKAQQISVYPFMLFPHTKWYRDSTKGLVTVPPPRVEKKMFYSTCDYFESTGYVQSSCWDFIRAEKNEVPYATCSRDENIGVGLSAHTKLGGLFYVNTFYLDAYIKSTETGLPIATGSTMPETRVMRRWFMTGLYRLQVDKAEFKQVFGIEIKDVFGKFVSMLKVSGIIRESRDRYTVTRKGKYVISLMTKTMMVSFPGRYYEECLKDPWPADFEM